MLLNFVINLLVVVQNVHSAVDAGVIVFGTTVAPNFNRLEGRGRFRLDTDQLETYDDFLNKTDFSLHLLSFKSSLCMRKGREMHK